MQLLFATDTLLQGFRGVHVCKGIAFFPELYRKLNTLSKTGRRPSPTTIREIRLPT